MVEAKEYFGGLPTKPDVDAIMKAYPNLKEGDVITYREIEEVIGKTWTSSRFRTVTLAWRRELYNEYNLHVRCDPAVAFHVELPKERVSTGFKKARGGFRKIRRSADLVARTDQAALSQEDRLKADRLLFVTGSMIGVWNTQAKQIAPPKR